MKLALVITMRTEPVAALESEVAPVRMATTAKTAKPNLIARKISGIMASGPALPTVVVLRVLDPKLNGTV
jgi:hypothetical protein